MMYILCIQVALQFFFFKIFFIGAKMISDDLVVNSSNIVITRSFTGTSGPSFNNAQ